jgi:Fe-S oxidoreductase
MEAKYEFVNKFRDQVLRCSNCGFCRAVCPVFGLTKRPAYNAQGKMAVLKEVMDGTIDLSDELIETLFQCTTCASCSTHCPSGVNVPEIIKQVRKDMVHIGSCHPAFKGMNQVLEKYTNIYAENASVDFGRERNKKAANVFFIGCVGSYRENKAAMAALDLLDYLQVDYTLIEEVCCSGVLEDLGYELNPDLAGKNVDLILSTGARRVITGCPYCSRTFNQKSQFAQLKNEGIEIIHFSQFIKDFDLKVKTDKRVTYHDPCDLGRHCGIYEEPRETIRKIAPNFVEMRLNGANALCCGAGGGVRGAFVKTSIRMARRRLAEVEEVGAEVLLTECNSCVHNFHNAKVRAQKFEIYTTVQFLMKLLEQANRISAAAAD